MKLRNGLIDTKNATNILEENKIHLTENIFDNDAIIMKGLTSSKISLKNKYREKPILTMDFSEFPYLAVWSKPNAPFICIEPWHGVSDTIKSTGIFAEKTNIITLKPNESYECRYTVKFYDEEF